MSVNNLPTPDDRDLIRVASAVRQLAQGRSNAVGQVTLAAGATTTTVNAVLCASESFVWLSPLTANAAAALADTYVSSVNNGTFTLTHANNAQTDRTFAYICLG